MSTPRSFPGFDGIYAMHQEAASPLFLAALEGAFAAQARSVFEGAAPSGPLRARWALGTEVPGDFVWNTLGCSVLVSERTTTALEHARLTGWSAVPVELADPGHRAIAGYQFLRVHGRCGPLDHSDGEHFDKQRPGGLFRYARGAQFERASWSGDDVFLVAGTAVICITRSASDAMEALDRSNVRLVRLTDVERRVP